MRVLLKTIALVLFWCFYLQAQMMFTEQQAIEKALQTYPAVKSARLHIRQAERMKEAGLPMEPLQLYHSVTADPDWGIFGSVNLGFQQNFPSARLKSAVKAHRRAILQQSETAEKISRQEIIRQVRELYQHLGYLNQRYALNNQLDSLWQQVAKTAELRYQAGEISLAEKLAIADKAAQLRIELRAIAHEIDFDQLVLGQLLNVNDRVIPLITPLSAAGFSLSDTTALKVSPLVLWHGQAVEVAQTEKDLVLAELSPGWTIGAMGQYMANNRFFPGWYLGIHLPISHRSLHLQAEAAEIGISIAMAEKEHRMLQIQNQLAHLLHEQEKYRLMLDYYQQQGKQLSDEILRSAVMNYQTGEIGFPALVQYVEQASAIQIQYLENLLGLNNVVIEIKALLGKE